MIFVPTRLEGVVLIELDRHEDERGFFARTYSIDEFEEHGLELPIVECSISFNPTLGTLRGLHFQAEPQQEPKLVRCTRGRIFDVAVDLRRTSSTYRQWVGFDVNANAANALFVPRGCAHGFLTLESSTEVTYSIGARYSPELARGARWDDPAFGIAWPFAPRLISKRDASFAYYEQ